MSAGTSFSNAKQTIRRGAFAALTAASIGLAAAGVVGAPTAHAQQATPIATRTIPPEIAREVDARLKLLAPIIRSAEAHHERLGIPVAQRDNCSAQTGLFVKTIMALKTDVDYAPALAKADMHDLENMTRFASCTLPEGLQAKLNVCSTFGNALAGHLIVSDIFPPKMLDTRPLAVRCPTPPGRQAALQQAAGQQRAAAAPRP